MIIGLGFKARSGKDTVADYLENKHGFKKTAFAKTLKDACQVIFGLTDEQIYGDKKEVLDEYWNVTPRYILQRVGTECMRTGYAEDIWVRSVYRQILTEPDRNWVITDCRFPNEAAAIKSWGGYVVRVDREKAGATGGIIAHPSETSMLNYEGWDCVIDNNNSKIDLYDKVQSMFYDFKRKENP